MDKIYTVLSVLLVISEIISANVESNEKLTLRIEDHITSENCNQTLMNIQVCFSKILFIFCFIQISIENCTMKAHSKYLLFCLLPNSSS